MSIFEVRVQTNQLFVDSFLIKDDCDMAQAKRKIISKLSTNASCYTFIDAKQKIHAYPAGAVISITITPVEDV